MDIVNTNPSSLTSLVNIVNSKVEPKLLTDSNYEVLSVKPLTTSTSKHNTVAEIRVDLGLNAPTKILTANDRYSRRQVEFTRIDLKDIAKFRGLTINAKGQIVTTATDIAGIIELLDAEIAESELKLIPLSDAFIVKAVDDSLGYVGSITIAGVVVEEEPEPEPEVPVVVTLTFQNAATLVDNAGSVEATLSVTALPVETDLTGLVYSVVNPVGEDVTITGNVMTAIGLAVDATITVRATLGTVTADHTFTITAA